MSKTTAKGAAIGRLAFRTEGDTWVCYYAVLGTMESAVVLGTIQMALVGKEARRLAFMELMRQCFADMIEEVAGERPTFPEGPQPAPEHERAGRA